ncbi:tRNA uridine-5-carboxymethylaminomethyl(34) synthesis enzyme MnmG [Alphaproteobacteria bacterium]|nr:tRNA uridine-5-carboxymethylaminomethyl(34) synthesis enzyme MnmG [Alphaproteobacteria bacterium]
MKKNIKNTIYDVVVIGGGHAGVEAACASARMKSKTLLITHKIETIGEMSCNPAIGGLGKGHLVREIDALDGIMGRAIDNSGIQFRMLNLSRGPAVQGPRAQADRVLYKKSIQDFVKKQENLDTLEGSVEDIILANNKLKGILVENIGEVRSKTLVLTTGTFLRGLIRIGKKSYEAGRVGDKPAINLAKSIENLKFSIGRLKTGTPPRIDKKSINFNNLNEQEPDSITKPFSFINKLIHIKQISCFLTNTNVHTHKIINNNIHLSPMYSGEIKSMGARYCPSIEDKVRKFSDKNSHQIFLEPEGLESEVIYPNGISTSLPEDVQEEFVHSIKGLEKAKIIKPGYAIEYDYVNPQELYHSLETKKIKNLFFAGQINGTTGYEEAAAQGIMAGINAALVSNKKEAFVLDRADGYIGVLIDDLVIKGTKEPYRMFTSRSEYRLLLRADNADQRLTPLGIKIGCVGKIRKTIFQEKIEKIKNSFSLVRSKKISPNELSKKGIKINHDGKKRTAFELLSYKNISFKHINKIWPETKEIEEEISEQIIIESQYSGYLNRQREDIIDFKKEEELVIPTNLDYKKVGSLSNEIIEKLTTTQPPTLGAASRISGVTPAAIIALLRFVKKQKNTKAA